MEYLITLQDKGNRHIKILDHPVFECYMEGDAETYYRTHAEIRANPKCTKYDLTKPFTLRYEGLYFADEGALFAHCKLIRNPIIDLKTIN